MKPLLSLLLKERSYSLLWFAHIISEAGNWLTFIAITVLAYRITESGLAVSGVFVARTIPALFLTPIAGVIVDRGNRKVILVVSDVVRGMLVLTLLVVHDLSYVYAVIGLTAVADLFFQPARSALIPSLVEERSLITANALLSLGSDALSIVGPALAGAIVTQMGIPAAFTFDAISFWLSASMLAAMSVTSSRSQSKVSLNIKQEWTGAFSFIVRHRPVLLLVLISALIMLGGGALNVLLIVFANEHLGVGDHGFAWLVSALGIGFVAGSLLTGITGKYLTKHFWLSGSLLALSLVPVAWSLSHSFPLALGVAVINGIANSVFNIVVETFLQTYVLDDIRGKVFSLANQLMTITSLISMSLTGWLSDMIGIRMVFLLAGLCIFPAFILSLVKLEAKKSLNSW